jgi:hypothetical protein
MSSDIRFNVIGCATCKLANSASHENQKILTALTCDQPFDVMTFDVWEPGYVQGKSGKAIDKKFVTGLCTMTGFAGLALIVDMLSATVAKAVFM